MYKQQTIWQAPSVTLLQKFIRNYEKFKTIQLKKVRR